MSLPTVGFDVAAVKTVPKSSRLLACALLLLGIAGCAQDESSTTPRAPGARPEETVENTTEATRVIEPYWNGGTWVFDDPAVGLDREPFVSGVPEIIDRLVRDIPAARTGFRLTFSESRFPGCQMELSWLRAEGGGNVYRLADPRMDGWLCPALFRYFDEAPKRLFVRADPKSAG